MYVPNYIPEPLEVPGNVSQERYDLRLAFIRRVGAMYVVSLALIAAMVEGLSLLPKPLPSSGVGPALGAVVGLLIGLELMRIAMRGTRREANYSAAMLPLVLAVAAWLVRELQLAGAPVWALIPGPVAAVAYGALCGRDFSFVGCWVLSLIASSIWIARLQGRLDSRRSTPAIALGGNAAFLSYLVYDLASSSPPPRRKALTVVATSATCSTSSATSRG